MCSLQREKELLSVYAHNYTKVEYWQVSSDCNKVNLKSVNILLKKIKMLIS